jgi:hypothetical protein
MAAVENLYLWATPATRFETSWLSNSSALDIYGSLAAEVLRPFRRLSASIGFKQTFLTADLTVNCDAGNISPNRNNGLKISETIEWSNSFFERKNKPEI